MDYLQYATCNRDAVKCSTECACVYCLRKITPSLITEWTEDYDETTGKYMKTAVCPLCGIDSIIPNSLVEYTDKNLQDWHRNGFNT